MRAVLALDGVDFKKHSVVISNFRESYIKTDFTYLYEHILAAVGKFAGSIEKLTKTLLNHPFMFPIYVGWILLYSLKTQHKSPAQNHRGFIYENLNHQTLSGNRINHINPSDYFNISTMNRWSPFRCVTHHPKR